MIDGLQIDGPASMATGLTRSEAHERWLRDGPNALPLQARRSIAKRLRDLFKQPMFTLLVAATVLYVMLGDLVESLTLASFVLAVLALTFWQEGRAEQAIESLHRLTEPTARVLREGQSRTIDASTVVVGDLLLVAEGDRIAADALLVQASNLQVDESMMTGESVPVDKLVLPEGAANPAQNSDNTLLLAGTFVVRGHAMARVIATGSQRAIGRIGLSLGQDISSPSALQTQTARLVTKIARVVLALSLALVLMLGWRDGDWLQAMLSGIALAMAFLPEEYSVVQTLFPALGARRLSRCGVLVRHLQAVESLGAVTVLCTDKTGTLTENRMAVAELATGSDKETPSCIWSDCDDRFIEGALATLVQHALMASDPRPVDPMDAALQSLGRQSLRASDQLHLDRPEWKLMHVYPLTPECRALSHVWHHGNGNRSTAATKGAPEAVMALCHLSDQTRARWNSMVEQMASRGLRVLAVARGQCNGDVCPVQVQDIDFEWLGLVGLADPLRKDIPQAMAQCHSAGIRVLMITGDHPATAKVIAGQAGLECTKAHHLLTGSEMESLDDIELGHRLREVSVCARISPGQKLRIVQALQSMGETVAMTGDGVNDAPALRAAHVGIAMGGRGTDVARGAADLVLVDDRFASIVNGIRTGRRVFDNLRHSMSYIFAVHIPIAGMALLPLLAGWPPILTPLHLALMELVIDPSCSLAFENEPEDPRIMQKPPRSTQTALLGRNELLMALGQGMCLLMVVLSGWWWARGMFDHDTTRSVVMSLLVLGNTVLMLFVRSTPGRSGVTAANPLAWMIAAITVLVLALMLHWPLLAEPLQLRPPNGQAWLTMLLLLLLGAVGIYSLQRRGLHP
jgi:Ca2+-transporting ATPase